MHHLHYTPLMVTTLYLQQLLPFESSPSPSSLEKRPSVFFFNLYLYILGTITRAQNKGQTKTGQVGHLSEQRHVWSVMLPCNYQSSTTRNELMSAQTALKTTKDWSKCALFEHTTNHAVFLILCSASPITFLNHHLFFKHHLFETSPLWNITFWTITLFVP